MLIIGPSGSGKTNALLNLIQKQDNDLVDKIYLYAKDLDEPKYRFLVKNLEDAEVKNLDDASAFIEHSNALDDFTIILIITIQKIKTKILNVFDDMIADIMSNK